jgi:hypothetical protein
MRKLLLTTNLNPRKKERRTNKMKTEIYLADNIIDTAFDNDKADEWKIKVEQLGMVGQIESVEKSNGNTNPFMRLNDFQYKILSELFNRSQLINDFNHCIVPLEIVDVIAMAINDKYFDQIKIHYCDNEPDPVVIGYLYLNDEDRREHKAWRMIKFLIARWGEELDDWTTMRIKAIEKYRTRTISMCKQNIRSYQRQIEDIDNEIINNFGAI